MFQTKPLTLCLSLLVGIATCGAPLLALAQQYNPPRRGLPGRREGAGTRGTCLLGQKNLMPLIPLDGLSATTASNPIFYIYVPAAKSEMGKPLPVGEFALVDQGDKELYRTTVNLSGKAGIVSYRLPTTVSTSLLKPGKERRWRFSVICDAKEPSKNPFIEGFVQRTQPSVSLTRQLQSATPIDRASLYAGAGIWQDAIATLVQQRCLRPQDQALANGWQRLFQSVHVQLTDYAQEPLARACSPMNTSTGVSSR